MSRTPTISVLMPVYNAERYLREAVESVLGPLRQLFATEPDGACRTLM